MPRRDVKSREIPSRERILEAASEEFATQGYAGARIGRIAHRCGLNVRMLYYHFASKEGLYRAVLRDIYERFGAIVAAGAEPKVAPQTRERQREVLIEALRRYCDLITAEPRFAEILVRESLDGAKRLRLLFEESPDLFQRVHVRAMDLIGRCVEQGVFRPVDPALAVLAMTSLATYLTATRNVHSIVAGRELAGDRTEFLTDFMLHGLEARG